MFRYLNIRSYTFLQPHHVNLNIVFGTILRALFHEICLRVSFLLLFMGFFNCRIRINRIHICNLLEYNTPSKSNILLYYTCNQIQQPTMCTSSHRYMICTGVSLAVHILMLYMYYNVRTCHTILLRYTHFIPRRCYILYRSITKKRHSFPVQIGNYSKMNNVATTVIMQTAVVMQIQGFRDTCIAEDTILSLITGLIETY